MAKNNHVVGKKRRIFLNSIMGISAVMIIATGLLTVSLLITHINIKKTQETSSELTKNITLIEQELSDIRAKQNEYQTELLNLEQRLSQYQPVIIPDSMKNN